jgi:CheY-like chemotaxis protein
MKDVELVCITPPHLPDAVKGDPHRLRQVLSNLIGNAVKFTSVGEIVVRVAVDEGGADGGSMTLRFSISDTGIGISPDNHKLLFQPFSQIDSSTGRRFGGTGLGLAIVRQLVELMDGQIGVDSALGRGSTFWFTARFAPAAAAPPRKAESLAGLRVLVVDDNATSRAYLGELVAQRGAEVQLADGGTAALDALRARHPHRFDLVLLDMHMPGMTGLDVAVELASEPAFGELATVLLTSIDVREDPRVALAKVRACVTKPVRPDLLAGCLLAIREHRSAPPLLGGAPAAEPPPAPAGEPEILVVDDNPVNLEVAAHMAETLGYRTALATNGAEAVQALRRRPYRLVLMDLQMPELDGYDAAREIRSSEERTGARTPIVAMTARVADTERRRALGAGFDDYLPKPIPLDELGVLFTKWLGPRERAAPVGRASPGDTPSAPDVIDVEAFLRLRRSGRDPRAVASKVVRLFLDDLPLNVRAILDGHQAADLATIQLVAHRMKSSAALVGALRLHRLCHDLELGAYDLPAEARARLIDELLSMAVEVQRVLEAWLSSRSGSRQP